MTDRPILFSGPMVRAILEDRKTQTRRVITQPRLTPYPHAPVVVHNRTAIFRDCWQNRQDISLKCEAGDRLWVREAWRSEIIQDDRPPREICPGGFGIWYEADGPDDHWGRLRPGIHMPRWVSRLTLTVTDVRVQRLQDISNDDALAEGVLTTADDMCPVGAFADLWDSINGLDAWDQNPWVGAYSFDVRKGNIDG